MAKAKRIDIPKNVRFEVFKRDSFTCQYCGRSAPDVILEVDHINPVANGGDNQIVNLITSCFDCNRGKGKKLLTDNESIQKQKDQLDELNKRREQLEMMLQWRDGLSKLSENEVDIASKSIENIISAKPTDQGRQQLKELIKRFGLNEVLESIDISFSHYYKISDLPSANAAFNKIGGICYNRKKQANDPDYEWKHKLLYQASARFDYVNTKYMYAYIIPSVTKENYFTFYDMLQQSRSWTGFRTLCDGFIDELGGE